MISAIDLLSSCFVVFALKVLYNIVNPATRLRAQDRLLKNIRYEEEVQEGEASGFQLARATTDQLYSVSLRRFAPR